MHLIGLARLGRDAELRSTPDGKTVANLALAFNYGRKGEDGNKPTQWIDASLWGDRAQKLEQYLTKGTLLLVHLSDPHIETYQKNGGGEGFKLVAFVDQLEFAGSPKDSQGQQQGGQQPQRQQSSAQDYARAKGGGQQRQAPSRSGFDDDLDPIPF